MRSDGDTVFGGDFRSTHIAFEWKANSQLSIKCTGCDPGKIEVKKTAWKQISMLYEFK